MMEVGVTEVVGQRTRKIEVIKSTFTYMDMLAKIVTVNIVSILLSITPTTTTTSISLHRGGKGP
jgi:hypothetical protein